MKECGANWQKRELERCWEANPDSGGRIFQLWFESEQKGGRGRTSIGGTTEKRGAVLSFRCAEFEM